MKKIHSLIIFIAFASSMAAQNVGIGTAAPIAKFHIKGAADTTQLLIVANSIQSNIKPLIKLRKSDGSDLMWIHSDDPSNVFIGINAGRVNNAGGGFGIINSFIGSNSGYSNTTGYENTATGYGSLYLNTVGYHNTANGKGALYSNTTGFKNTASGRNALFSNTTGNSNIAIGDAALLLNTIGSGNTANGTNSLYSNTTGGGNTANGANALYSNSIGSNNTANGYETLYSNSTGTGNTANGYWALYSNTTGFDNTAIGGRALYSNTTGYANTAIGYVSLSYNTAGARNIAMGWNALGSNTTASENIAIGVNALQDQSFNNGGLEWESGNVAVGNAALLLNKPTSTSNGIYNTAIGNLALRDNTTGAYNTGVGASVLYSNTTGFDNTASGYNALYHNTTGYSNIAIGANALYSNTTGGSNIASGSFALYYNTTGFDNTAIGQSALQNNIAGYRNIAIGDGSGTHPNASNVYNTVGIGNNDQLNGFQDQVIIGNTSTWFIGGKVNWGIVSDARIKNTVMEDVKGLDFILRLRPVTYHISNKALIAITKNKETPDYPGKYDCEKIKYSGFLAQEVEQAAKAADYEFSGYDAPKNEWGLYTIKYAEFVVPLVKAVQELSQQTIAQKKIIEQQQLQYEILLKRVEALEKKN